MPISLPTKTEIADWLRLRVRKPRPGLIEILGHPNKLGLQDGQESLTRAHWANESGSSQPSGQPRAPRWGTVVLEFLSGGHRRSTLVRLRRQCPHVSQVQLMPVGPTPQDACVHTTRRHRDLHCSPYRHGFGRSDRVAGAMCCFHSFRCVHSFVHREEGPGLSVSPRPSTSHCGRGQSRCRACRARGQVA